MNALEERSSGKLIGTCGLLLQRIDGVHELEVGYAIMPEFRNQGFAAEAALCCITYAFDNQLAGSVISIIHERNIESETLPEKTGCVLTNTRYIRTIP